MLVDGEIHIELLNESELVWKIISCCNIVLGRACEKAWVSARAFWELEILIDYKMKVKIKQDA